MTGAVDVGATVEAGSMVEIKLPRLRVVVEQRQAERLRDVLGKVLPEQITDLMHDPRIADVDVLRAAQAILAERWQDTENLAAAIEDLERKQAAPTGAACRYCDGKGKLPYDECPACNGTGRGRQSAPQVARTLRLLHLWGDSDPEISGPYANETERTEAAQDYRRAHGDGNGVYRLDVTGEVEADVLIEAFAARELEMPPAAAVKSCERCGATPALFALQGVTLCEHCYDEVQAVAVGDRVRDPHDGTWREIVRIDGLADGGTCHMGDGGCMSVAECAKADKRLPSESLS